MQNVIYYYLTNGKMLEQETPYAKEYIDEKIYHLFEGQFKVIYIKEKNIYIPISSILFIEVKETKNGNN